MAVQIDACPKIRGLNHFGIPKSVNNAVTRTGP